jgi:hypothetical protein
MDKSTLIRALSNSLRESWGSQLSVLLFLPPLISCWCFPMTESNWMAGDKSAPLMESIQFSLLRDRDGWTRVKSGYLEVKERSPATTQKVSAERLAFS